MPLTNCPDCGKQVSPAALSCPGCGRPMRQVAATQQVSAGGGTCPHCGANAVGKVRGLQGGGEVLLATFLILACLIPGIIYYVCMESVPYCSGCGRRVWK